MRFIVDAQLPPALARWLASQGCDAAHVFDLQMGSATDREIWALALSTDAIVVTKDEDFSVRALVVTPAPSVVWVRYGNVRTPQLIAHVASVWDTVRDALLRGEKLIELV